VTPASAERSSAGFTLLEVLLALALTATIMSLAGGALQGLSRGAARSEAAAARIETVTRGLGALRMDLQRIERATQISGAGDKAAASLIFSGRQRTLTFVRIEPGFPTAPGSYLITYAARKDKSGNSQLVRIREPFDPTSRRTRGAETDSDEVVVIEGPYELMFSYFAGAAVRGVRTGWRDTWSDPVALPDLIRLELRPTDSAAPTLPVLVVRPTVTLQAACLGDRKDACAAAPADPTASPNTKAPAP
jgi:general secretion pathway protein J